MNKMLHMQIYEYILWKKVQDCHWRGTLLKGTNIYTLYILICTIRGK